MDLVAIRKTILTAVASDDALVDTLVLKGGNALALIHEIGNRASLEMDFSLENDLEDADAFSERLFRALRDRFDSAGMVLFDERFAARPSTSRAGNRWGGYNALFKLISRKKFHELSGDVEAMRRQSEESGPGHLRTFKIEISKYEHCDGKIPVNVDEYTCYVYSLPMIVAEKLRAICQQMPEYTQRSSPTARARDFYDIHVAMSHIGLEAASQEFVDLATAMFVAKDVDTSLLQRIADYREFHREDWSAVQNAVRGPIQDFDFYFDYVVAEANRLSEALGMV